VIQSPEHDLAEWRSASGQRHKLRHSNSGREKFGSAYRQKKQEDLLDLITALKKN